VAGKRSSDRLRRKEECCSDPYYPQALKDKACFDQGRLHLGAVTWPNGADMDPAWMYEQVRMNKLWSVPF
jgi:hypothetical protein